LFKAHETRYSLAVPVRRLSWSISIHFVAIHSSNLHAPQPQIAKKTLKPPILEVQGHSRSSLLTLIKSLLLLLVMISSMSVPIFNSFHATRANTGKITTFSGVAQG